MLRSLLGTFAFLILAAVQPAAAEADRRWGLLAELVERDFQYAESYPLTVRWIVPGESMRLTIFLTRGRHQDRDFFIDKATGGLILDNNPVAVSASGELALKHGPSVLRRRGPDRFDFMHVVFDPLSNSEASTRIAASIASGELKAANPSLTTRLASGATASAPLSQALAAANVPVAQMIAPGTQSAAAQADPRWGILAEMVGRDFETEKALVTVRWIVPGKRIQLDDWFSDWNLSGETNFKRGYQFELDPSSRSLVFNVEGAGRKQPISMASDGSLVSLYRGKSYPLLTRSADNSISWDNRQLFPVSAGGKQSQRLAKLISEGRITPGELASAMTITPYGAESSQQAALANLQALQAPSGRPDTSKRIDTLAVTSNGPRLALVIGNSAYAASMGVLPNPANDAGAMANALGSLGFKVTLVRNADQKSMRRAISAFGQQLSNAGPSATGLFFYAGHGIQAKGINYLIPTDANIQTQADVEMEAVGADAVLEQMEEAGAGTNIVILDACRNMPLVRGFRSATNGLAPMDAPNGSFIAYSTAPGSVAADGMGANSPFVIALIKNLGRKGESIEAIFRDVRREVVTTTEGMQTPWDSSSLMQPFYFAGR
jgi:hypothetical protein